MLFSCGMLCTIVLVLVGNYYNLLGLLNDNFIKLKIMVLLIILGSGARAAAAAATGPACPAPPGLAELASQLCLSLGMVFVSIPNVSYVLSIYRYLRVTVPESIRAVIYYHLWYLYIVPEYTCYINIFFVSVFIRILLYRTYPCTCTFLFVQLMFCQDTLYCDTRSFWCRPYPIPRSSFLLA